MLMANWRYYAMESLLRLQGRPVFARYRQMTRLAFEQPHALNALNERKLKSLLQFARETVPYYRHILSGFSSEQPLNWNWFQSLPLLDKNILRTRHDDLISIAIPRAQTYTQTSGGSTGEPVQLLHDRDAWDWGVAATLFFFDMAGKKPGEREVKLWGSERDILEGGIGVKARAENFLYNRLLLNSFMMSEPTMRDYARRINRFRPAAIWTYVDSIYELASFIEREQIAIFSPRAIITTAGTLYPHIREIIERVFRAPVLNQYGSREVGAIAAECPHRRGLHVFNFNCHIEVLREDGSPAEAGEMGEVVVTSLVHRAMPLIRYRIGDTATFSNEKCPCGRHLPLLASVNGRVTDHFRRANGGIVHGEFFTHLMYDLSGVQRFKFVQEAFDLVRVFIVPAQPFNQAQWARNSRAMEEKIQVAMGKDCRVCFEVVEEIPPSPSGKYRYTESLLP